MRLIEYYNKLRRNAPPRRFRRRGRGVLYVFMLGAAFLAGALAKSRNWDWIVVSKVRAAWASVRDLPEEVRDRCASVSAARELPIVSLEMKPKHLGQLERQREAALRDGFLRTTDFDYVPANLTHAGQTVPVKARLKGDRTAHLVTDKWSLRIKVKNEQRPFGMRTFSLQHPMTRYYLNEWGFLENLRWEGIPAVRYQFVRLILNGTDKGIYALEEHFANELIQANQRGTGVIVAFEERPSCHIRAARRGYRWEDWDITTRLSAWQTQELRTYDTRHLESDPELRAQRDQAVELLRSFQEGRRRASEVFDVELMGRYMALVDLWRAWHAVLWQNTRYYYNPATGRLEPIGFDAMPLWGDTGVAMIASRLDDRSVNGPLRDPEIAAAYLGELERVCQPGYLSELRAALGPEFARWQAALRNEFRSEPRCRIGADLEPPWDKLAERQAYILEAINTDQTVIASAAPGRGVEAAGGEVAAYVVDLRNITVLPIEVVGFRLEDGPLIPAASVWARRRQFGTWENADGSVGISPSGLDELRFRGAEINPVILGTFFLPGPSAVRHAGDRPSADVEVATRFPGQTDYRWARVRMRPPRTGQGSSPVALTTD